MTAIVPTRAQAVPARRPPARPATAQDDRLAYTRARVRDMLERSESFRAMPMEERAEIARNTLEILNYLGAPENVPYERVARARRARRRARRGQASTAAAQAVPPQAMRRARARVMPPPRARQAGLLDNLIISQREPVQDEIEDTEMRGFTAEAAREGAEVAGLLLEKVNFVDFVGGLITNVFTAIVDSSIKQMEAYAELVKSVAQTLNQFRDENVTANQARDHLVDAFPEFFEIGESGGMFGGFDDFGGMGGGIGGGGGFAGDMFGGGGPRVQLRQGVDEQDALRRVRGRFPGEEIGNLDSETIEQRLVPAARTELATSRQQLLATMVLMGINRIIITDGRISAKVLYTFRARDTYGFQRRAVDYDYGDRYGTTVQEDYEEDVTDRSVSRSRDAEGATDLSIQGGTRWTKGSRTTTTQPIIEMMSAVTEGGQSQLDTSAQLAGTVDVNFKSETFPLEKMADSFQIGMIQNAANRPRGAPRGSTGAAAEGREGEASAEEAAPETEGEGAGDA